MEGLGKTMGVAADWGVEVTVWVGVKVGVWVKTAVQVEVGVPVGVTVSVKVGVEVGWETVTKAPVTGSPLNCTECPFDPEAPVRLKLKVPLAFVPKSAVTVKVTLEEAGRGALKE